MLTTTVAGRTWNFSHAIGRNAGAGNGFTNPYDIAVAPGGVLYVVNRGSEAVGGVASENKRIGKLTIKEEFIGDFARGDLIWPAGIALDRSGNVYCSDEYRNMVFSYDADGQKLGEWGEAGSGEGQLRGPSGIAFDSQDNMLVVDSVNGRVQKFTRDGKFLTSFGSPGSGPGQLNRPWGITIDKDGNVYVADWGNNRVQVFSPDGTLLMTLGAGPGDSLKHPADVAVDSQGDIYVTDWGNKRVQIYSSKGAVITALYGDAIEFSKWAKEVVESNPDVVKAYRRVKDRTPLGLFERPVGIAVDEEDRIIVTDSTRGRLQVYAKEKDFMDPQFNL
jgi:DNA-binding beta-propeller fold protein YncE